MTPSKTSRQWPLTELTDSLDSGYTITLADYQSSRSTDSDTITGTSQSVSLPLPNGDITLRWGIAAVAIQEEPRLRSTRHRLELRPWLHSFDDLPYCALYQNMTIPEIVKAAAKEQGFTGIEERLTGTHTKKEYIVQYNEPLRDFLIRIMAEDGIFHYFSHDATKHVMVLADSASSLPKFHDLHWRAANASQGADDSVWNVQIEHRDSVTKTTVNDYNELTPTTTLSATQGTGTLHAITNGTGHTDQQKGQTIARRFQARRQMYAKVLHGNTNATDLTVGSVFKLKNSPYKDANTSWAVTDLQLRLTPEGEVFMSFAAVPPEAVSPPLPARPRISGPVSGIVTGGNDDEIHTDEYGRIKVKLLWDTKTKADAGASCWLRVSQPWAGNGYGALFLPRVGQEVIVDFFDGNPSRPFVSGCLYTGSSRPGWKLPDNKTVTGILGRSSPKGNAGNEISLDDAKDNERLYFHAQKLLECLIEHERRVTITGEGGDSLIIDKASRSIEIKKGDDTLTLGEGSRSVAIEKGDDTLSVKGKRTVTIGGDCAIEIGGNLTITAGGKITLSSTKNAVQLDAKTSFAMKAGTTLTAESTSSMTLTGKAGVDVKTSGSLSLSGSTASLSGKGTAEVKSAATTVSANGPLSLSGAVVKIN